jgi:phospholipase C
MMTTCPTRALVLALAALLAACSHASVSPTVPVTASTRHVPPGAVGEIQHVVFIVQENRTFDNLFGGPNGLPGADTASSGRTSDGKTVDLREIFLEGSFFVSGLDPNNYHYQWLQACHADHPPPWMVGESPAPCKMDGFDLNAHQQAGYPAPVGVPTIYSYVNRDEVAPYWFIAKTYGIGDHFFMGHNSESYTGHQYIFSSQSHGTVDSPVFPPSTSCGLYYDYCAYTPWGCDSPPGTMTYLLDPSTAAWSGPPANPTGPLPCFGKDGSYPSIADLALAKGASWRLYAYSMCSGIVGLDANYTIRYADPSVWARADKMSTCRKKYGLVYPLEADTAHFRAPQYTFIGDETTANSKHHLANITWILPGAYTSDHPGVPQGYCGPSWVAKVINAIGSNAADWNSTVIFVLWDDWGGFYDHVAPYVVRDQTGPGFRVPLLVVSPYVRKGAIVHKNIEFATLNKFVEETFRLGSLDATDATPYLNNLDEFFDFHQQPLKFKKIPYPTSRYPRCNYLPEAKVTPSDLKQSRWLRIVTGEEDEE